MPESQPPLLTHEIKCWYSYTILIIFVFNTFQTANHSKTYSANSAKSYMYVLVHDEREFAI